MYYSNKKVTVSNELIEFEDLGPEAIHKLVVKDWVCTVSINRRGKSIFERPITRAI